MVKRKERPIKRCENCGKVVRSWNKSGLCISCYQKRFYHKYKIELMFISIAIILFIISQINFNLLTTFSMITLTSLTCLGLILESKSKKGQLGIVIFILIILILLVSIIVALAWMNKKSSINQEVKINLIPLYLKAVDSKTLENINANFVLSYTSLGNEIIVANGTINDWTEYLVDTNQTYHLFCWNENHYVTKVFKLISNQEIDINSSRSICESDLIGDLKINHIGDLSKNLNRISLNISTNDKFQKLTICESHTAGILSVDLLDQIILCDSGSWRNWTEINNTTKQPIFLTNNTYVCGNNKDWTTTCKKVNRNICYSTGSEIPNRLKNKLDNCWYIGKSLINSSMSLNFEINTFNKNNKDYVEFYLIDSDRRLINNQFQWVNEINVNEEYKDISARDFIYKISYDS